MHRRSVVRREFSFDIDGLLDKRGRADCDRLKNKQRNEYCCARISSFFCCLYVIFSSRNIPRLNICVQVCVCEKEADSDIIYIIKVYNIENERDRAIRCEGGKH